MDLLGDLGTADQLTSARAENAVLSAKVKELTEKVKVLQVENQSLLAEVEIYRKEAALPSFSNMALGKSASAEMDVEQQDAGDDFVRSGNGVYPSDPAVTLSNLHGGSNCLTCTLHPDDTILATGGADAHLSLCQWGAALAPVPGAAERVVQNAIRIRFDGPVISTAFAQENGGRALPIVAAGCMDGSVKLVGYGPGGGGLHAQLLNPSQPIKHVKYVKTLAWSPTAPILATASADGTVTLSKISNLQDSGNVKVETVHSLHLDGAVEALCFSDDGNTLYCYARGTPYLSCFDLQNGCTQTKVNLNEHGTNISFEDHVSFAVMDMAPSPNNGGKYLALATDASRNIILDAATGRQVRNLYGHTNDGFSQPRIAWSKNGQYLFGNTQDDSSICVWDIASSSIVQRLEGHKCQIRAIFSSKISDTLVTTSFDKDTKIWVAPV